MEPSRDCKGEGPEPGGLAPLEGHSDLFFVGFAQLWDPVFFFGGGGGRGVPGTFDDITFVITSNNHMVDDLNTILFMIIGKV